MSSSAASLTRLTRAAQAPSWWPAGVPGAVLLALVFAGIALRMVAILSWWPTTTTLDDGYQVFAGSNPFADPQHPAGYALILGAIGALTRNVSAPMLLQHAGGVAAGLLLWAAVRRVTASPWPGLLPAAAVLLNPDQVFLEHAIMSESWAVLITSAGLYAATRAWDDPRPWWRWPLATGATLGVAVTIRSAGLLLIPVALLALALSRPRPLRHVVAPLAAAGGAATILVTFAAANAAFGNGFQVAPSSGWYLYGRVAQFADCRRFTPPSGTRGLCESSPPRTRPGAPYYLFDPSAPAPSSIGPVGTHDDLVGAWARRAALAQPGDFATTAWQYLRAYWVPSLRPARRDAGVELDPQLDFTFQNPFFAPSIKRSLEAYYDPFRVRTYRPGLRFLHGWQRLFRFGGTALAITTLLTLIGLLVGTRRSRVGVVLFGVGGLALIVAPSLTGSYTGRYAVPMAGPLSAAAAITILVLWRLAASWRRRSPDLSAPTDAAARAGP